MQLSEKNLACGSLNNNRRGISGFSPRKFHFASLALSMAKTVRTLEKHLSSRMTRKKRVVRSDKSVTGGIERSISLYTWMWLRNQYIKVRDAISRRTVKGLAATERVTSFSKKGELES